MKDREPGEMDPAPRNFWAWVAYQFFYRIGWQFKMESTMMAGIVSYLTPSPAVMGLFTTLNNVARNVAPLVAAPVVDRFRRKRVALLLLWGVTILFWAALTLHLWTPYAADRAAAVWVFGACYTLFFFFLGAASVAQGALLGKIIPADQRGRAMAMGMGLSGVINVAAILLVSRWVQGGKIPEPRNYALAFSFTTGLFAVAGLSLLFVREKPSPSSTRSFDPCASLRHMSALCRAHPNLARLLVVNTCVGVGGSMLQFYTGYWRLNGTMTPVALMLATVSQVFWQSLSSSVLGRAADRVGNRILICRLLWIEASIPLAALVLGGWDPFRQSWLWYLGVYTLVGVRFPLFQLLVNYLLEVIPQEEHAMALGAVNVIQLLTAPAPLLLGLLARGAGYPAAFIAGAAAVCVGAVAALRLQEVRGLAAEPAVS